ncbi:MAG: outer membrane protein assembly factor BamA [Flavobacteriia bacterium]|nr:outer membrane protein assembly factor BamA [Flavobacteriia bacterium]
MNIRILLFLIISPIFIFGQTPTSIGENSDFSYKTPKEYELGPIKIKGVDHFDHNAILLITGLRQGQKIMIPGDKITNAIKKLWEEEVFSNVEFAVEKEINGVVYLTITLQARPKLSRFKFKGVKKREVDKIREEIDLFSGKTITENLVFTTGNKIKGFFREKGFYNVQVNINRINDTLVNESEIFDITVVKGKKVGIKKIEIEGNHFVPTWKLRLAMKDTKQKALWRVFKRSKFTQVAYDRDKEALLNKFYAIGLRDASIVNDTVFSKDKKNLIVRIKIEEGNKYFFGKIDWIGNTLYRSSYLDTVLGIKNGDTYNKPLLDQRLNMSQDGRDISSLYMDRGYLFFQINAIEAGVKDNYISYQMRIIEGKEARVKRIIIKGNDKTNENVIRREIRTKPGDLFNRNDIIRTQRELAQLGYFNEQAFQVNPMPNPQDGTVDIEYVVEEKSSDQIELSGGYGGQRTSGGAGLIGTLGLTFNNFSIQNFFNKSAWSPLPTGDGQRLSLRAQSTGRYYQGYTFSFTEPWMGGKKPNSFTIWLNHTQLNQSVNSLSKKNPDYQGLSITGIGIGYGRRKKIPDDYFNVNYELSYQYYDVRYVDYFDLFRKEKGFANDISFKYILARNSIDNPIYPKEGSKIAFNAKGTLPYSYMDKSFQSKTELTNKDKFQYLEYYKIKFTGEWFLPLTNDKKLVLMPRIGFGFMGFYNAKKGLTPFERFYLGGNGLSGMQQFGGREIIALRGYDDNSLNSSGGDPIITKYTLELRYPISLNPQATFYLLAFGEAGNTYPTIKSFNPFHVKRAAGIGIRVFLPMFGMLGLDYGFGFDYLDAHSDGYKGESDQSIFNKGYFGKLNFTIGMNLGEL